jgi:hypothetical protein
MATKIGNHCLTFEPLQKVHLMNSFRTYPALDPSFSPILN